MSTTRDPDRLVLFTDAVVAIAITLLVLPWWTSSPRAEHATAVEVITEHQPQIFGFLLSFVVIAQLRQTHHRMSEHVKAHSRSLTTWNLLWLPTIVGLPFARTGRPDRSVGHRRRHAHGAAGGQASLD